MANEEIKLRPKGPLTRPLLAARGKSSYSEPSSIANGVKLDVRRKGSKKSTQNTEAQQFDSSYAPSPFLDPKILERKVMAAKKAQS
ncbi:hypothetical protein LTR02_016356 [Friedmanniomyces endolithicus]|uniref:Uncharacterized protein n=1 Tax=Friedmanniomyces endolithicus TaxID=329885 RepID=A0A4U0ULX4_9PEZI|nr:hypothetical protein LTS09_012983 [Friedmanniomyces endolithicus]KAK0337129.1 hypothetical protein LTR94_005795 [Friedmanniomyces endolithicus]KAK0769948.1 hypothetical protein LTR59_016751 [Friedmanniomyces endolithicus]KAK0775696.1 hypothetical protein LTR75_016500 [Friedmanniomyces endolithicus]KAK0777100.1 hypothetical protein LTR38_015284 [Friedmanniomyces endolithicus]